MRGVEDVRLDLNLAQAWAAPLESDGSTPKATPVGLPSCPANADRCTVAELDGDPLSELTWMVGDDLFIAGVTKKLIHLKNACTDEETCGFFEFDGLPGAEWMRMAGKGGGLNVFAMGGSKMELMLELPIDCSNDRCEFADVDADGRVDVIELASNGDILRWLSREAWELPEKVYWDALWGPKAKNVWADVNGDGHDDLLRIDGSGNVSFHPTFDARGRVQEAALAFSTMVSKQEAAERAVMTAELNDTILTLDPPMSDLAFEQAREQAELRVKEAVAELLEAIPQEAGLQNDEDVRWARELAMMAAVGQTVLKAGAVGVSARGNECANAVLHEVAQDADVPRQRPSYMFDVATALSTTTHAQRVARTVDALTAMSSGFRCLNNDELANVDEAFTNGVLDVASELHGEGRPLVAKWLVDASLPIALLTFDAVKYNSLPSSYRLFRAEFTDAVTPGVLPEAGFDFDTAAFDPDCETFVCQTYGNDRRADPDQRWLVLDQIGIWLPDPVRSGRLAQLGVDPHELFEGLADLRNLGAGDCSLFEVVSTGFTCRSHQTCDSEPIGDTSNIGNGWDLMPSTSDQFLPGGLGSPLTHLNTFRDGLAEQNGCDTTEAGGAGAGAGAVATGCVGPALDPGGGRFSQDPELDNLMRCALEMGAAPVDVSVDLGEFCLAGQTGGDDDETGDDGSDDSGSTDDETSGDDDSGSDGGDNSDGAGGTGGPDPDPANPIAALRDPNSRVVRRMIAGYRRRYPGQTSGLTDDQIAGLITNQVADVVDAARDADLPDGTFGVTRRADDGSIEVLFDFVGHYEAFGTDSLYKEVAKTLVHEAVHVLSLVLEDLYGTDHSEKDDHEVTDSLGWGGMCADGPCDNSCGGGDTIFGRFAECIEPGAGASVEDVACNYAQDVCEDRRQGAMGYPMESGCSPSLPVNATNPECYVVQCGQDFGSLANACCSAEASPGVPVPVLDTFIGPGPMPPPPGIELSFEGFVGLVGH